MSWEVVFTVSNIYSSKHWMEEDAYMTLIAFQFGENMEYFKYICKGRVLLFLALIFHISLQLLCVACFVCLKYMVAEQS